MEAASFPMPLAPRQIQLELGCRVSRCLMCLRRPRVDVAAQGPPQPHTQCTLAPSAPPPPLCSSSLASAPGSDAPRRVVDAPNCHPPHAPASLDRRPNATREASSDDGGGNETDAPAGNASAEGNGTENASTTRPPSTTSARRTPPPTEVYVPGATDAASALIIGLARRPLPPPSDRFRLAEAFASSALSPACPFSNQRTSQRTSQSARLCYVCMLGGQIAVDFGTTQTMLVSTKGPAGPQVVARPIMAC